jgi:hypothetical protein
MLESKSNSVQQELESMRLKADLQVTSHSYLRDYYLGWGQRLNLYTLLFSAVLLLFTLSPQDFIARTLYLPPDGYKWVMAVAAFFTFCISLVDLAWNPASKSKAHDQAVGHYLRMNFELRNLMMAGQAVSRDKVRWIQDEFLDATDLPRIPEDKALVFKKRHLVKLALSKMLEENPHRALWWLRLRLMWNPGLADGPSGKAGAPASKAPPAPEKVRQK